MGGFSDGGRGGVRRKDTPPGLSLGAPAQRGPQPTENHMARRKTDDEKPRPVELLSPKAGIGLIWPFHGGSLRGYSDIVVRADDPLLDTGPLPADLRSQFGLIPDCNQRDRLTAAPEGATVTPHTNPHAARLYARLGYEGTVYVSSAPPEPAPEPKAEIRAAPEEPIPSDDLEVPPRDDVEA